MNLNGIRDIEKNSSRDFYADPGTKTMMHIGPYALTETIYEKLRKCRIEDDCGEYVVLSFGVFTDKNRARMNSCPVDNSQKK